MAIGEPIRLGSNNEFEIEQHPISDELIIKDTVNGKVAYVKKDADGQIGGDGVLIESLKQGKPMADDGRTYDTIQEAEYAATGWVFVPPGTYDESVRITTDGLTLQGAGFGSFIQNTADDSNAVDFSSTDSVTVRNLSMECAGTASSNEAVVRAAFGTTKDPSLVNCWIRGSANGRGVRLEEPDGSLKIVNNIIENTAVDQNAIHPPGPQGIIAGNIIRNTGTAIGDNNNSDGLIIANNIIDGPDGSGIEASDKHVLIIGNRVMNATDDGIRVLGAATNTLVANNRVSGSTNQDIEDSGTGTIIDGNLTGLSN